MVTLYEHYLWMIGSLKDRYKMDIVVPHRESHEMIYSGKPKFKLIYGKFEGQEGDCIVFCPHIHMQTKEAIVWFSRVYELHPNVMLWDVYIEDDRGEYYLGQDAYDLDRVYQQQAILEHWLENSDEVGIKEFVNSKVYGRHRDPKKMYDATSQRHAAYDEFMTIRKPDSEDDVQ